MKKLIAVLVPLLLLFMGSNVQGQPPGSPGVNPDTVIDIDNNVATSQSQDVSVTGAESDSLSLSSSDVSINTTEVSNYKNRTSPISVFPPSLPYWNHGGWGTIEAYFPNGLNNDVQVYERIFNPENEDDMQMLRGVLESLPYEGPLDFLGGVLNSVGTMFGGPDNFHHGRGFEIANSLVRKRRPKGKPLLVFIDSNIDTNLLRRAGYAYVGKVSMEGKVERNWDHVYDATIAEALPWDVDLLLISGGMKGVTVGSNLTFPGAGGAYSQANYSISLFGSISSGITEGKGKALLSAAGYRFSPALAKRRRMHKAFYEKFHARFAEHAPRFEEARGPDLAWQTPSAQTPPRKERSLTTPPQPQVAAPEPTYQYNKPAPRKHVSPRKAMQRPSPTLPSARNHRYPGIQVSRELYEMAGFKEGQRIENLTIK